MLSDTLGGNLTSRTINDPFLIIIANSARMLAQAAKSEGYSPVVVDCFGDQDTRRYAQELICVPDLSEANVITTINDLKARYPLQFGIYGAGFEQHQSSLRYFCSQLTVLGNEPDVFTKLNNKPTFFATLKKLDIPFPETTFHAPEDGESWLVKPMQGQGGVGIRRLIKESPRKLISFLVRQADHERNQPLIVRSELVEGLNQNFLNDINVNKDGADKTPVYWQKFQEGIPHSVLFLADGQRSQIVGFNRQWTAALSKTDEFLFSGIINHTELTERQQQNITQWINQLVLELTIKGLNSLDIIQDGKNSYVLEINPRPPASVQLYDGDLLSLHIKACRGELPASLPQQNSVSGLQVVYARQNLRIPDAFDWPEGSQDIPCAGSTIGAGQPICSIINTGRDSVTVHEQLQKKLSLIKQQLEQVKDLWNTARA